MSTEEYTKTQKTESKRGENPAGVESVRYKDKGEMLSEIMGVGENNKEELWEEELGSTKGEESETE